MPKRKEACDPSLLGNNHADSVGRAVLPPMQWRGACYESKLQKLLSRTKELRCTSHGHWFIFLVGMVGQGTGSQGIQESGAQGSGGTPASAPQRLTSRGSTRVWLIRSLHVYPIDTMVIKTC